MTNSLQTKVDALAQELAETDEATRRALLARLDRVAERRLRVARVNAVSERIAEDPLEAQFDNLPV